MKFTAFGHKNIKASHKTTLEFTKDKNLTERGDCIIGVNADFDLSKIKEILNSKKIKITIKVDSLKEETIAEINKNFHDKKEIVIRKTNFISERTLGIKASKSAVDLNREIIKKLKNPKQKIQVMINSLK